MSSELEVLTVENIESYVASGYLLDSYEVAVDKALKYCYLLLHLVRQTDSLAAELKENANAARERAANTTRELTAMRQRADAAEAALAAVPRNEIKQLYIATITPSDPERYANHRRVAKWLFPDSEVQP